MEEVVNKPKLPPILLQVFGTQELAIKAIVLALAYSEHVGTELIQNFYYDKSQEDKIRFFDDFANKSFLKELADAEVSN